MLKEMNIFAPVTRGEQLIGRGQEQKTVWKIILHQGFTVQLQGTVYRKSVHRVLQNISIVDLTACTLSTATSRGSCSKLLTRQKTHPVYNHEDNIDFIHFYVRTQQWSWSFLRFTTQVKVRTNATAVELYAMFLRHFRRHVIPKSCSNLHLKFP